MSERSVYHFGGGRADGGAAQKATLGGKGANLAEMARLGVPVPPGFTLATPLCHDTLRRGGLGEASRAALREAMATLEETSGLAFGDPAAPLLVSVRSGAAVSMPGMMDTILNLGLSRAVRDGLEARSGSPRFARDAHRRLLQMFATVVWGMAGERFEAALGAVKRRAGVDRDVDLDPTALDEVIARYEALIVAERGSPFPDDPHEQLEAAVEAVFASWNNPHAVTYRRIQRIPHDLGTAVNVQQMVFGNLGDDCGTGVGFTRDPTSGARRFYGEFLRNAQGEDVVAGVRTPQPVHADQAPDGGSLQAAFPAAYADLLAVGDRLEAHFGDVQDLEFTIERGQLFLLQTRRAKRTGRAWLTTQTDLVDEGLATEDDAVRRIPPDALTQLMVPVLDAGAAAAGRVLAEGLPASPGGARGTVVFSVEEAVARAAAGDAVILVRDETTAEDVAGMHAAAGILTARGGMTSHAAVVARGMGKPAIVGCAALTVHAGGGATLGGEALRAGTPLSLDGESGRVYAGELAVQPSEVVAVCVEGSLDAADAPLYRRFARLMAWAAARRRLAVRANADTPKDAAAAVALGAEGIGLCRTEHMFFAPERIDEVRRMILAADDGERAAALARLEPMQVEDFVGIFRAMAGRPVTIRTLDPPLHEFLPHGDEELGALARRLGLRRGEVVARADRLREVNPMLGHRGCRLGLAWPAITRMQARAVARAAARVHAEGVAVHPEIMVPLVGHARELALQRAEIEAEAAQVFTTAGVDIPLTVGTMIEVPRAALTAAEIAAEAAFFSFGTNDLTQMTLGISRDDASRFLGLYADLGVYDPDPFASLDAAGVGRLVAFAAREGRAARPDLKLGICGEHGGDPASIALCEGYGLDYVSCSPYRLPVALLAAAQARLAALAEESA